MRRDRRRFLGQVTGASAMLLSARGLGLAEVLPDETPFSGSPVRFGVVGCGPWGREILATLAKIKGAQTVAVCDTYPPFLKKGLEIAPEARGLGDAASLVALPEVEAVVVATPSHRHREVAALALDAGKHVYCEAPLAHTLEDAKAIARAAQVHSGQVFQGGPPGPRQCPLQARHGLRQDGGARHPRPRHRPMEPEGLVAPGRSHSRARSRARLASAGVDLAGPRG